MKTPRSQDRKIVEWSSNHQPRRQTDKNKTRRSHNPSSDVVPTEKGNHWLLASLNTPGVVVVVVVVVIVVVIVVFLTLTRRHTINNSSAVRGRGTGSKNR